MMLKFKIFNNGMQKGENKNIQKEFKKEFLFYLEERIPEYRMPAGKFFSSFNASLKMFAKNHGVNIMSILEIRDISVLVDWLGKLSQNENAVFNARRRDTKAQEGLRYYIDFLQIRMSNKSSSPVAELKIEEDVIEHATEGLRKELSFLSRSRNRAIRDQCAARDNYTCRVCGINFAKVYGERGKRFIEVHHIKPLSSYEGEHEIPLEDLIALCSNCHSMVHYGKNTLSIEKLKELYEQNKKGRDMY